MHTNSGFLLVLLLCLSIFIGKVAGDGNAHQFGNKDEVHDEEHIKQHLENKIEVEKLSEEQQRFHYFSMHDLNKDNLIDGIEILKALTHEHARTENDGPGRPVQNEVDIERLVDAVLEDLDQNGDGCIDYSEYLKRQS